MLLEDVMEPFAREMAAGWLKRVGRTTWFRGVWEGYRATEDLVACKREADDRVSYVRPGNHRAHLVLSNIRWRDPDPASLDLSDTIILSSVPRVSDSIEIPNDTAEVQSATLRHFYGNERRA